MDVSDDTKLRFTSARTGEVVLEILVKNGQISLGGAYPTGVTATLLGKDLRVVGTVRDHQGPILVLHEDGREEHLANCKVEVLRGQ